MPVTAFGSEPQFERISLAEGLSQSSIRAMLQGPNGFIWVGTQAGLDRYDGYGFRSFAGVEHAPGGLSHWLVRDLLFDRDGYLWVGTADGLNRVDARTGRIRQYVPPGFDREEQELIFHKQSLIEDSQGNILSLTSAGPVRWDRSSDALELVGVDLAGTMPSTSRLLKDRGGAIWLAGRDRTWHLDHEHDRFVPVLDIADRVGQDPRAISEQVIAALPGGGVAWATEIGLFLIPDVTGDGIRHLEPTDFGLSIDHLDAVAPDSRGDLWIRARNAIVRATGAGWGEWQVMLDAPWRADLARATRDRLDLAETRDGRIWFGGLFGVAALEPGSDRLRIYAHDPDDENSLPPTLAEAGYTLMTDRFGVLWVGTDLGGLARLSPRSGRFVHVRDRRPGQRSRNVVRAIAEQTIDGKERVWAANHNDGVTVWERVGADRYQRLREAEQYLEALPGDTVRSLEPDPDGGGVWIGGGGWFGRARQPGAPVEIAEADLDGAVRVLRFDRSGLLWVGSADWLRTFSIDATGAVSPARAFQLRQGNSPRLQIFSVCFASNGDVVAGGYGGLAVLDPANGQVRRIVPDDRPGDVPKNLVFHVHCADDGTVWFATRGAGLGRLNLDEGGRPTFDYIDREQGLVDNVIYAILPGPQGELWLSSNHGLMRFFPESGEVDRFGRSDGIQEYEFNHTVAHIGASGRYYFGGINGWNVFDPEAIQLLPAPPLVYAESVRVNGQAIPAEQLRQDRIELDHRRNRLDIEYVGLHFAAPEKVEYAYRLTGLDEDWIEAGTDRLARYGSLPPGDYVFELKAVSPDGVWSAPKTLLRATINPPPWATPWAWGGYALALGLTLLIMLASHRRRERRLQALVDRRTRQLRDKQRLTERQAAELEDALEARTTLFANISHEFRTPLTLIGAAFEKLRSGPNPDAISMGNRYVARLLRLVEQLLDLARLRSRQHAAPVAAWRLDVLVEQTVQAFDSVARNKSVALQARLDGRWQTRCAPDVVEKILLNLLHNAVKYTPSNGRVLVRLGAHADGAELTIEDTGPGIPEAEQAVIFERFYRTESAESARNDGAGIGLALVKEAVAAIGGAIDLHSTPGVGSRFSVTLSAWPCTDDAEAGAEPNDARRRRLELAVLTAPAQVAPCAPATATTETARGSILVVEDNADLRGWIAAILAEQWRVIEADDGRAGLEQARRHLPDVVITDLMMPGLDGFGLLEALRTDTETSHIPVLMLTARQDAQTRLKAFTLSADAFLPKPFNVDELKTRLEQIVLSRRRFQDRLQQHWRRQAADQPSESPAAHGPETLAGLESGAISQADLAFLERVENWLEQCCCDPEADIGSMAEAVYVTPRTLQRKLKALTGESPAKLLRNQRLQCACRDLAGSARSVTEIAHASGFSSVQYFSRVFREAFGQSPDKWRNGHG